MFGSVKRRVRDWVQRAGLAREFKDVFDLGGVPAFSAFYHDGVFVWKKLYRGYYDKWHKIAAPTVKDQMHRRDVERLGMPKAICAELAGLIWSEQCQVHIGQDSGQTVLQDYVLDVLRKNGFWLKMQAHIEQVLALGGGAIKAWYEVDRDREGNELPESGSVRLGYCMADQFIPTAWDNARVKGGVFISREAKDGYYYTRLEWHKWDGLTYYISNETFRSGAKAAREPQDILGCRYPLNEIYPFLSPETPLQGLTTSLFAYYRPAVANNLDDNSPLGVSIYANALSTLKALDICFDSFVQEFRLGKKRIIVPAQCLRTVVDQEGNEHRYFDTSDEAYVAFRIEDAEALKVQDNTVELRVAEHEQAINALLSVLCLQIGFSAGTFTFDRASGLKTATEVISENSKTYKTVKGHQQQIKEAIAQTADAIIQIASLYDVHYQGQSIKRLAQNGWETKIVFDDSILQDRQTNINEGILLTSNGLMSKMRFMVETLGYTEDEARQELKEIANEGVSVDGWDAFDSRTQEGGE